MKYFTLWENKEARSNIRFDIGRPSNRGVVYFLVIEWDMNILSRKSHSERTIKTFGEYYGSGCGIGLTKVEFRETVA